MERHNGNQRVIVDHPWDNSPECGRYKHTANLYSYKCGESRPLTKGFTPKCQEDPELFFPDPTNIDPRPVLICRSCPERDACLQLALDAEGNQPANMRHGIYGGTRPAERFALAKQRQKEKDDASSEGDVSALPTSA